MAAIQDTKNNKPRSLTNFCQIITHSDCFVPISNDWHILITDVISSTKAIESGRYKDVNIIGACSISTIILESN